MPPISGGVFRVILCTSIFAHLLRRILICLHDVDVAGAAAEVAGDRMSDLVVSGVGVLAEKDVTSHQHSGCTEAALQAMLLVEPVLKWIQFSVLFETFDCQDVSAIRLHGERGARLDRAPVHYDRARAAVTRVATDVRSSETQRLAQEMDQQQTRFDFRGAFDSVDVYFNRDFSHRLGASFGTFERSRQRAGG